MPKCLDCNNIVRFSYREDSYNEAILKRPGLNELVTGAGDCLSGIISPPPSIKFIPKLKYILYLTQIQGHAWTSIASRIVNIIYNKSITVWCN